MWEDDDDFFDDDVELDDWVELDEDFYIGIEDEDYVECVACGAPHHVKGKHETSDYYTGPCSSCGHGYEY